MIITKISLWGFNGFEQEYTLSENTLITGKRGVGKSTVIKAIQFVLNTIPSANLQEIFNCYYDRARKDEKFSVSLTFSNGQAISRGLQRNEKGEVKQFFFDDKKKNLSKQDEATFLSVVGVDIPDIKSFLDLSDQKQIAYLFSKFQPADIDIEALTNQIEMLRKNEVEEQNKIIAQRRAIQVIEEELELLPVMANVTIESIRKSITIAELDIKLSQDEINKIKQEEREKVLIERLERLEKIPNKMIIKEECQITTDTQESLSGYQSPNYSIYTQLSNIIDAISEPTKCYKCGAEGFTNPALIPLKLLRGGIKE